MKRLFVVLALLPFLGGCSGLEMPPHEYTGALGLRFVEGGPYTRSGTELEDGVVKDVNVYVFAPGGELVCGRHFPQGPVFFNDIAVSAGKEYSIYVLANWGEELLFENLEQLQGFSYAASEASDILQGKGADLMCGKAEGVVFPVPGDLIDVELRRLYSRVELKFYMSYLNSSVEFAVKKASIKNVPKSVSLFSDNVAEEVTDGAVFEGEDLSQLQTGAVSFHLFENMQGTIGSASSAKGKAKLLSTRQRQVCSYIELECSYHSLERTGTMTYRFYLGTDHTNCNVPRNSTQTVTVRFRGNVSPDENSVSVDNSALLYRPTLIIVDATALQFRLSGQTTYQSTLTVYPVSAYDKRVVWSSSNPSVATVDQNGLITAKSLGKCTVTVTSVDRPDVYEEISVRVSNY